MHEFSIDFMIQHPERLFRIIALDVDGTLMNDNKEITPVTKRALKNIAEAGAMYVVEILGIGP